MKTSLSEMGRGDIENIILGQGRKVLQIINSEGWEVIENTLKQCKARIEAERKKEIRIQSTREKMLYWNGMNDGVQEAIDEIYNIVTQAKAIEANREKNKEMEEL